MYYLEFLSCRLVLQATNHGLKLLRPASRLVQLGGITPKMFV